MLRGMMMDRPLLISSLIDYAGEVYAEVPLVAQSVEGPLVRSTYRATHQRIVKLANALIAGGVKPGDRVATLAWNTIRHFELYYAISSIGAVCHTINPRLSTEQMIYIVNHAQDLALFFDTTFAPLVEKMRPQWPTIQSYVAMTDRAHMPEGAEIECYEEVLAGGADTITWPEFDENAAAALCFTSGTTGEPKGSLYSHRSTVLHAMFAVASVPSAFGAGRSILPVVPLFHVNAWGLPYAACLTGTSLVFPGPKLDGPSLFDLMDAEQPHASWGVPTVWQGLLMEMKQRGRKPVGLKEILVGGSAASKALIETFEREYGIAVLQGWGMTEMSPLGTVTRLTPDEEDNLSWPEKLEIKAKAGRRCYGVEMKIVDEAGARLPHDDKAVGELYVRGAAIVSGYFENPVASKAAIDKDGWFATGDVARIAHDGYLTVVDRTKDLVKSGGEWISSIDVENAAMAHPGLHSAAVIGIPHPKWTERPLLVAIKAAGADPKKEEILALLDGKLAKWQLPDDVVFVEALPLTATGKVSKRELRAKFADYKMPERAG